MKFDFDNRLKPMCHQTNKGSYVLNAGTDLNYHGELGLHIHSKGREEYVWNPWNLLDSLLVLLCMIMVVSGHQNNHNSTKNG